MPLNILIAGMMVSLVLGPGHKLIFQDITGERALPPKQLTLDSDTVYAPASPYYSIQLRHPGPGAGAVAGSVAVVFPENPFGVAVTRDGTYLVDLYITARGLRPQQGSYLLAWVASPDLDPVKEIGVVDLDEPLRGRVEFDNKFVVFVTIETDPEVDRPTGRIVLRGVSRSGRMESMFSHGFCPPGEYC